MSGYHKDEKHHPSVTISDDDVYTAMREIPGYLDITPGDFKELYFIAYRHAVERIIFSVRARDIMNRNVISVNTDTPLKDAAELMARNRFSGLPVLDDRKRVAGVISEKDFLSEMGAEETGSFMKIVAECLKGKGCVAAPVRPRKSGDIMTSPAVSVKEETTAHEICTILTDRNIKRVPVMDNQGHLAGIVSRGDIIRASFTKNRD